METFLFLFLLLFHQTNSAVASLCETLPSGEVVCANSPSPPSPLPHCSIPRLPRSQITPELFQSKYYLKQPLIVTDVPTSPSPKRWTTQDLLSNYGGITVGTGSSRTITKMGGTGRANAKLKDVIKAVRSNTVHHGDVDVYAFDRDSQLFDQAPELINDLHKTASDILGEMFATPKFVPTRRTFNATQYHHQQRNSSLFRYFLSLGGKGSGVHLHHHSDGWSYLFEGQKRWFVRPPYTLPRITHMGFMRMRYWLNEGVYPKLQKNSLLECVQYPGDLIYIPESWWHGTINEGSPITLSVSAQLKQPVTDIEKLILQASLEKDNGKNNRAHETLQTLLKKIPTHEEAWYVLGIVYGRVRKHHKDDELHAKQKVHDLMAASGGRDNYSCDVMNNLATALIHHEKFQHAEQLLRKVIAVCPWDNFPYSNLASALHEQGREEEAEQVFEQGKKVRTQWETPDMVTVGNEELYL